MYDGATVLVVVPAYCEERLLPRTLLGIPGFVDAILVVDDASPDQTSAAARGVDDPRVQVLRHGANRGVGAAIITGYRHGLQMGADVVAVMAGDAQMDPADLPALLRPITAGSSDYVKGNRFAHSRVADMPLARRAGGRALSVLTRKLTGLEVDDTQCGYTAIGRRALDHLDLSAVWPRYGYPNDLLGLLAAGGHRVSEVPVRPVYADEKSGVRPWHMATIFGVLLRRRMLTALGVGTPNLLSSANALQSAGDVTGVASHQRVAARECLLEQ